MQRPDVSVLPAVSVRRAVFALAFLVGSLVFLHPSVLSGGRLLPSDELDGRFVVHLQEHWWRVLRGLTGWRDLGMFHPTPDTLGLSDAMLGFGLTHAGLRAAGLAVYQAFLPNVLLWAGLGFWGLHRLLTRVLGVRWWLASVTSGLFLCFSPVVIGPFLAHPQILAAWMVPWAVLAVRWWIRRWGEGLVRSLAPAAAVAASVGTILMTAFQTGWFAVFGGGLVLMVGSWLHHGRRPGIGRPSAVPGGLRRRAAALAALAVLVGLALAPFLSLYLPQREAFGDHPESVVRGLLPVPADLVNPSPSNLVWGWVPRRLLGPQAGRDEHYFGLPGLSLALFLAATVGAWRRRRELPWCAAAASVVVIAWVLMIRVGDHSLWEVIRALVPGAGAVRAVFRFNAVLSVPMLVTVAMWAERRLRESARPGRLLAVGAVLVPLLFAEQWIVYPAWKTSRFDRHAAESRLAAIPPPPEDAACFFVLPSATPGLEAELRSRLDAWAVAQRDDLPTLNGFSGLIPPEHVALAEAARAGREPYLVAVGEWAHRHHLLGAVAELDLATGRWQRTPRLPAPLFPPYRLGTVLDGRAPGARGDSGLLRFDVGGWSDPEPLGTWTEATTAFLELALVDLPRIGDLELELDVASFRCRRARVPRVRVFANGHPVGEAPLPDAPTGGRVRLTIPGTVVAPDGRLALRFELPDAARPVDCTKRNPDPRLLGMLVRRLVVTAAP